MPLIEMKCDNDDGTINWYRRVCIIYGLLGGEKRAVKTVCKGNPDMLRQLPNVIRHFDAIERKRLTKRNK